ncbi:MULTISPECIES: hypothetical protein [unclassified Caulobacter]|uniref:MmcQ/YjbR family DNA-binding protein n=1 Tax=unclassified Caulobacter TaxID=2648921 RepID=UPI0004A719C6|nr:hypothetical protein [Caulobacter sp. UNC358MFTsu5.1]
MTFEEVRAFAFGLPGVTDGTAYGHPCLKAHGKFLTRVWDDGDTLVCPGVTLDEREMLIEAEPETFFVTDHYRNYPYVLIRLSRVEAGTVEGFLARRWRATAPKTLLKRYDAEKA